MSIPWIQTRTGKVFRFDVIDVNAICLEDIAFSLARQCRYNGHVEWYTVAEHSVLLSDYARFVLGDDELARVLLLHDASEAYLCDVPKPLKAVLEGYYELEDKVQAAIHAYFMFQPSAVAVGRCKNLDVRILQDERMLLLGPEPMPWGIDAEPIGSYIHIKGWERQQAYYEYRQRFRLLFPHYAGE